MKSFITNDEHVGMRADVFVSDQYPKFARSALLKLFDKKLVIINGASIKAGYKLKLGDKIRVDDSMLKTTVEAIDLPIIYEDDDVIVINKPAGVLSHANGGFNREGSVASFIRIKVDKNLSAGGDRAGIVHRLDRATSGVMICAKNSKALTHLQKQFAKRTAKKTYLAVVSGALNEPQALIDGPIGRNPKKPMSFRVHSTGKPAITKYTVINQFGNYSLLELEPQTGRTHQLRVHLHYINHPIVGDFMYEGEQSDRLMLHADKLKVQLPNKKIVEFKADLPNDFNENLELLGYK